MLSFGQKASKNNKLHFFSSKFTYDIVRIHFKTFIMNVIWVVENAVSVFKKIFLSVLKIIRGQPIFILILKYRKDLLVTSRHPHITNSTQENAFEKLIFGHVVNKLSYFTEPESSLPCSKEPPLAPILSRFNPTHFILHHIYSSLILI